jgi:hypothetical protein
MKTDEGIYLTHVLNGTRSGRCHLIRPLHLHYLMTTWYLQYTSSGNRTFWNFFRLSLSPTKLLKTYKSTAGVDNACPKKFKIVRLPELTPV